MVRLSVTHSLCLARFEPILNCFANTDPIGDFNDANMLVNSDYMVSGVIDFGDSVERYVFLFATSNRGSF